MLVRVVLALLLAGMVDAALAQKGAVPNGCGSDWSRYFVPNSIPILQCNFKDACNAHDNCYARCEGSVAGECEYRRCRPGGDLFGRSICKTDERLVALSVRAAMRRNACDATFFADLRNLNIGKNSCRAFAVIYRDAVKQWGDGAFIGIDPDPVLAQSNQQEYERAIREFFVNGTEAQFKKIVDEDDAGRKAVDMKLPITFSRDKGLINTK